MASKTVVDAVASLLAANPITGWPFILPNTRATAPSDGSTFVAVEYPVSMSSQISMGSPGSNIFRETGTIRFVVAAGNLTGLDAGLTVAETLRSLFRNAFFGTVRCWEPSPPVVDDRNRDGNYYRLSVSVPYWCDVAA